MFDWQYMWHLVNSMGNPLSLCMCANGGENVYRTGEQMALFHSYAKCVPYGTEKLPEKISDMILTKAEWIIHNE